MAIDIAVEDLLEFEPSLSPKRAEILIKNAIAVASLHAPCLAEDTLTEQQESVAFAVILDAVRRHADSGSGALSSETNQVGPFGQTLSYDNRSGIRTGFYQSEVQLLRKICGEGKRKRSLAFSIDTIPNDTNCRRSDCGYLWGSTGAECDKCGGTYNDRVIR